MARLVSWLPRRRYNLYVLRTQTPPPEHTLHQRFPSSAVHWPSLYRLDVLVLHIIRKIALAPRPQPILTDLGTAKAYPQWAAGLVGRVFAIGEWWAELCLQPYNRPSARARCELPVQSNPMALSRLHPMNKRARRPSMATSFLHSSLRLSIINPSEALHPSIQLSSSK